MRNPHRGSPNDISKRHRRKTSGDARTVQARLNKLYELAASLHSVEQLDAILAADGALTDPMRVAIRTLVEPMIQPPGEALLAKVVLH